MKMKGSCCRRQKKEAKRKRRGSAEWKTSKVASSSRNLSESSGRESSANKSPRVLSRVAMYTSQIRAYLRKSSSVLKRSGWHEVLHWIILHYKTSTKSRNWCEKCPPCCLVWLSQQLLLSVKPIKHFSQPTFAVYVD